MIIYEFILVACDREAIDPETRKSIFFGVLMRINGAASVDNNIKDPKIAAWFLGAMSNVSPEAA